MSSRILSCFFVIILGANAFGSSDFPKRPIKIFVYTKPGGAIDVFSRKFAEVAKRVSGKKFLIVNKPGAGGIIALRKVAKSRPDGYTIGAVTKSNISKFVTSRGKLKVAQFSWLAQLVRDPEAVIVKSDSRLNDWKKVLADAQRKPGQQKWLGPAMGGNDHITAMKIWKNTGMQAKWVPYQGGGKAMAALMGGHGSVYVGNPGDIIGKADLKVAAISSPERMQGPFKDLPTFTEVGINGLDNEIMWRGFLASTKIPQQALKFYKKLFAKVDQDPEWRSYLSSRGGSPVLVETAQFEAQAQSDYQEFRKFLKSMGRRVD